MGLRFEFKSLPKKMHCLKLRRTAGRGQGLGALRGEDPGGQTVSSRQAPLRDPPGQGGEGGEGSAMAGAAQDPGPGPLQPRDPSPGTLCSLGGAVATPPARSPWLPSPEKELTVPGATHEAPSTPAGPAVPEQGAPSSS